MVRRLWDAGFATMRAPASGAKAKRVIQPDVIAVKKGFVFCFEVKARKRPPLYIQKDQVLKLMKWAERAGAKPFIAIYTDRRWFFLPLGELKEYGDRYKVGREELRGALDLGGLVGLCVHHRLTEFTH